MTLKAVLAGLLGWLILSFVLARLVVAKPSSMWLVAAILALIGVVAAAVLVWWVQRRKKAAPDAGLDPGDELAQLLRAAETKLAGSTQVRGARLGNLPVFLVMGPPGAGKTTTVEKAGIEPELLAGQVYQNENITPTRLGTVWFARQAVFIEAAAALLADKKRWASLIGRIRPSRLAASVSRNALASRAAVVLLDCERLQARTSLAEDARDLRDKLTDISRQLGISLPVYVLFTKADKIRFFLDYVQMLNENEAKELLGAALPLPSAQQAGSYEERQAAALNGALSSLYRSLADHRVEFLRRQADAAPLPVGYEFPREFRKLREPVVQFLVDLCRPSQLTFAPFLRGFYFTGVRPVRVEQAVYRPQPQVRQPQPAAGATGIFRAGVTAEPVSASPAEYVTRRAPQWVFLSGFFPSVVLDDHAALGESGASVKVNVLRRAALIALAAVAIVVAIGSTVSYTNNRSLEKQVQAAAADLVSANAENGAPTLTSLQNLDHLRSALADILTYNREGAPLSYRWGLYAGNSLAPKAKAVYFARFRQLLLARIQANWVRQLNALPDAPGPNDSYDSAYNALKSYLITTSNHDKSSLAYLAPQLMAGWPAARDLDPERLALARKQFDFYASELQFENPYSSDNDANTVAHARSYLGRFAGIERVYNNMLTEVNSQNPPLDFNRQFPGSAAVVVNSYTVPGAFTKQGFAVMTNALQHADKYFAGEEWVLGNQSVPVGDRAKLEADMKTRYNSDYVDAWRKYIRADQVVGYRGIPDAAGKLKQNAGPASPLLASLCLASENTAVSPVINNAFSTLHKIVPPGCTNAYIGPTNTDYMKNLGALQVALEQVGTQTPDPADPSIAAISNSATTAKTSALQLAQSLGLDPESHLELKLQELLQAPITGADGLVRALGPAALNGKGAGMCAEMRPVFAKYPFNPRGQQEASLADVNAIFKPGDGSLWKFYDATLAKFVSRTGDPIPGSGVTLSPRFLDFFRRAAAFSNAAYAGNAANPKIDFALRAVPSDDIQSLKLTIDGTTADFPAGSSAAGHFSWPGATPGVSLQGVSKNGGSFNRPYDGLWAAFRFFDDANRLPPSGVGTFEWDQKFGATQRTLFVVKFDVSMAGAPPVFARGYFSGLNCVSEIATAK